jgi:hypothetical protein
MSGSHEVAEQPEPTAKPALSPDEQRRARLCRLLIYACQTVTAAISVAVVILMEPRIGRAGPPPELWLAWGINAILGALGGAAAVILLWPVSRERWLRAAACLAFCPVMHLGAVVAFAAIAGCLGLIR